MVVVELKRDKTPRDIVAQVLDYASWVKNLSHDRIREIAGERLGENSSLEEAFQKKFGTELPDILNQDHRKIIVSSKLDSSTERIVNYLSDYSRINAVTFSYFKKHDKEYLARVFLVEPGLVDVKSRSLKKRSYLTQEELKEIADTNGVGELYSKLVDGLRDFFDERHPTTSSLAFQGIQEGKRNTIFSLIPGESDANAGLKFQLWINRFCKYFNVERQKLDSLLPADKVEKPFWRSTTPDQSGYEGFF